jgi:hypothetical protein
VSKLAPRDDYPDSVDRVGTRAMPFQFYEGLEKPSRAFRAWVKGSARRCLSADETMLVIARPVVYRRPRETAPYDQLLRKPKAGEIFFWTVIFYSIDQGKRTATQAILPRGVTVTKVSFDGVRVVLAMKREDGSTIDATVMREALAAMPRGWDVLRGKADHAAAFAKLVTPGAAREAPPKKKQRRPTVREYRAAVVESLAKLRPALIADLRSRVFVHATPDGAKELGFEVHYQELDAVPIVGYWMDGQNGQVQTRDRKGNPVLVPNLDVLPGTPILSDSVREPFTLADIDTIGVGPPLVLRWFINAWREAGGAKAFPLPATIQFHDGGPVTKLSPGRT